MIGPLLVVPRSIFNYLNNCTFLKANRESKNRNKTVQYYNMNNFKDNSD